MGLSGRVAGGVQQALEEVLERRFREAVRQQQERQDQERIDVQRDTLAAASADRAEQRGNELRRINLEELEHRDKQNAIQTQKNAASDMAGVLAMPGMSNEAKASEIMGSGLRTGQVDPARVIEGLTRIPTKKEYTYTDPRTGQKSLRSYDPSSVPDGGLDLGNEPSKPTAAPKKGTHVINGKLVDDDGRVI
jgi:hypothetical protein